MTLKYDRKRRSQILNNMKEVFCIIKDFPDYAVSNLGNVKSLNYLRTRQEKLLSPKIRNDGYLQVCLYKNGEKKHCLIHRLVAEAFLPNPNNYPQINHIDENKSNNCLENLEWCSSQYNNNYGTKNEKYSKKVEQYDLNGNLIATWKSTMEIQRQTGFHHTHISDCCLGKRQTAYGFIWRYI